MSEETDKKQDHGDNGFWDFKKAVNEKTTCITCQFGGGPFLLQGARTSDTQPIPIAPVFACENTESPCYMSIRAGRGSCECWKKKQATPQPNIIIAHKPVPNLKISDLKGGKG